ncbi:MAG: phosphoribosyl-ATP pyrophosphohydrolase [Alphaproteobacteria bacterium]|nr:MAG: phosphoribosyl-ATP pyrophosphohydrolase [Alphaproteobacteria bacterium]
MHRRTNKLIRDKIPDIIRADGRDPVITVLTGDRLIEALQAKMIEEYNEYLEADTPHEKLIELADMLEAIFCIAHEMGTHEHDLLQMCFKKREQHGAFLKGYYYEGDKEK